MRVVATTLTGNNESIIADALRSVVDWVDVCLVIDTGVTDRSLQVAREIAGDKYAERTLAWSNDFSSARNFALDAARELGGTWAVTVDTDERLQLEKASDGRPLIDVRAELARAQEGVLYVADERKNYVKERFFRLPMSERWSGPTHEAFAAYKVGFRTLTGITFSELGKPAEAYSRKFQRDVEVLRRHIETHPKDPRWHFYLGESHRNLRENEQAIAAYDACAALRGWDEESAWACFRAAECLCALERYEEALDRLCAGHARHAGFAELTWLAGFVCYKLGRDVQAIYWAQLATVHGLFRGDGASIARIGFRDPVGLWEGPYDVLRWAHKRLGNAAAAAAAEQLWVEAKVARERA
ncbi:MAG TPA: glycosyltransferase [Polyangiaceae bacterium]|nr:glycosyltransferase [Polyangiaceae bacterium]